MSIALSIMAGLVFVAWAFWLLCDSSDIDRDTHERLKRDMYDIGGFL